MFRNIRVYPAKSASGALIPNTWLIGVDINVHDGQELRLPGPGDAAHQRDAGAHRGAEPGQQRHDLGFDGPVAGTVLDKDGEGTGFTSVQPNTAGTQYKADAARPHRRHAAASPPPPARARARPTPRTTPCSCTWTPAAPTSTVQGRILGPMSDLTAGFQQKAVWFGPDQNNYLKVEIEHRTDTPGVFITVFKEEKGMTSTIGQVPVADPAVGQHPRLPDHRRHGDRHAPGRLPDQLRTAPTPRWARRSSRPTRRSGSRRRPGPASSSPTTGRRPRSPGVFDWFRVV